jgi:hypothetical protein
MKPFAIYLILLGFAFRADGQTNHSPSGPMYVNHIYYYLPDSLTALEQNTARMESKTKALGFGGSEGGFIMDGEKSTVRLKSGDTIRFAVKIAMAMADSSMMIRLYKFDSKKGSRLAILSSQGSAYSKGKKSGNTNEIPFNVQKETDDFILIPASRLVPGEYGFLNMMMMNASGGKSMSFTVFAFGVD